jgi:hypothetical protein
MKKALSMIALLKDKRTGGARPPKAKKMGIAKNNNPLSQNIFFGWSKLLPLKDIHSETLPEHVPEGKANPEVVFLYT